MANCRPATFNPDYCPVHKHHFSRTNLPKRPHFIPTLDEYDAIVAGKLTWEEARENWERANANAG